MYRLLNSKNGYVCERGKLLDEELCIFGSFARGDGIEEKNMGRTCTVGKENEKCICFFLGGGDA